MSLDTVKEQLLEVTGLEEQEESPTWLEALADKVAKFSDAEWSSLENDTQIWVNVALYCKEHELDIPGFRDQEYFTQRKSDMDEADAVMHTAKKKSAARKGPVASPNKKAGKPPAKAAAKPAKPAKPAKAAKAANGSGRGRKGIFDLNAKITLKVKDNPHRKGSGRYNRWPLYRNGMTVQQALDAGLNRGNLFHSVEDGHISID